MRWTIRLTALLLGLVTANAAEPKGKTGVLRRAESDVLALAPSEGVMLCPA